MNKYGLRRNQSVIELDIDLMDFEDERVEVFHSIRTDPGQKSFGKCLVHGI